MDKTFTQEANVVNGDQYYPTGNVTLYAKWEEGAKVTFDFCEADEAYSGDEYVHTYYMKKNNYINAYNDLEGATFGNMVFYGWYTDEERKKDYIAYISSFRVSNAITFYAKWVEGYDVTYNAGDGKLFDGKNTLVKKHAYGEPIDTNYVCYSNDSSKAFLGWSSTNGGSDIISESTAVAPDKDTPLYAVYGDGCQITFDANGGIIDYYWEAQGGFGATGKDVDGPTVTLTYPRGGTLGSYSYFDKGDMEIDGSALGKKFSGWSTSPSADEIINKNTYVLDKTSLTLYAVWKESYTVTFDANGGHFGIGSKVESVTVLAGKKLEEAYSAEIDDGRILSYWTTEPDGGGIVIDDDDIFNYIPTSNITLYAQYEEPITITYKPNGGYFYNTNTDATDEYVEKVLKGKSLYPKGDIVKHNDDTLGFAGWSTEENDPNGEHILEYDIMNGYTPTKSMTLYAVWKPGNKITIHANADNATIYHDDKEVTSFTMTIVDGDSIYTNSYVPEMVNNEDDLIFDQYNTKADGSGERVEGYYYPKKDVELFAQWKKGYKVTYHATEGYFPQNKSYSNVVTFDESTLVIRYPEGKKVSFSSYMIPDNDFNKAFLGWSLTEKGTVLKNIEILNKDTELYAVWDDANEITLDGNGGKILWGYISAGEHLLKQKDSIRIGKGKTILKEGEKEYVVSLRDGYTLRGWSTKADGSDKVDLHNYVPKGDETLYAIWEKAISAEFDANGGKFEYGDVKKTILYVDGETVGEIPEVSNGTKVLVEWNTMADGTGNTITKDTPVTDGMKAYAIWDNSYRITFNGNGGWVYDNNRTIMTIDARADHALNRLVYGYTEKGNKQSNQRFTGWYSDKACTTLIATIDTIEDYVPTSDITLYAGYTDKVVKVTGVSLDKKKVTIGVGDSHKLEAAVKPGNATNNIVIYKSDNEAVATVAEDGTVTGKSQGSAKITVTTNDGGYTDTCEVTVDGKNAEEISKGINGAVNELEKQKTNGEVGAMQNTVKESLKELGTVDSLADKAASNNDVAGKLQELEDAYVAAADIKVDPVANDPGTQNALKEVMGDNVNTNNVSVSGAGLNAAPGQTAKVEFEATSEDKKMPISDEFTNAMQMDITLKVGDSESSLKPVEELVAPITIVLPLPRNIKKSVLYVLHFYADGTYELIKPKLVNNTMVITVSHFSTFAFVELANGAAVENDNNNNNNNDPMPAAVIQPTSAAAGTKTTTGNGSYVVSGNYEVKYQASAGKKIKKLSISSSVTIDGQTYTVTSIGKGAVKNCKKLTSLTIPESVVKIEKGAVTGCGKLGKITVNGNTLKTVQKGAFKGVKAGAKVTVYAKDQKTFDKAVSMLKKGGLKNAKFKFKKRA